MRCPATANQFDYKFKPFETDPHSLLHWPTTKAVRPTEKNIHDSSFQCLGWRLNAFQSRFLFFGPSHPHFPFTRLRSRLKIDEERASNHSPQRMGEMYMHTRLYILKVAFSSFSSFFASSASTLSIFSSFRDRFLPLRNASPHLIPRGNFFHISSNEFHFFIKFSVCSSPDTEINLLQDKTKHQKQNRFRIKSVGRTSDSRGLVRVVEATRSVERCGNQFSIRNLISARHLNLACHRHDN